jgi:8-oxo-dGTP pyrophosphatase MutT (NUDIX family)
MHLAKHVADLGKKSLALIREGREHRRLDVTADQLVRAGIQFTEDLGVWEKLQESGILGDFKSARVVPFRRKADQTFEVLLLLTPHEDGGCLRTLGGLVDQGLTSFGPIKRGYKALESSSSFGWVGVFRYLLLQGLKSEDLKNTAVREAKEEGGVDIDPESLDLLQERVSSSGKKTHVTTYLSELDDSAQLSGLKEEGYTVWVDVNELLSITDVQQDICETREARRKVVRMRRLNRDTCESEQASFELTVGHDLCYLRSSLQGRFESE